MEAESEKSCPVSSVGNWERTITGPRYFFKKIFYGKQMKYMLFLCLYMESRHTICIIIKLHRVILFDSFYSFFSFPPSLPTLFSLYTVLPSSILAPFPNPNSNPKTYTSLPPLCVLILLLVISFGFWFFEIGLSHLA